MGQRTIAERIAALEAKMSPEYRELAAWMTGNLYRELIRRVEAIGLPRELATVVANDAVTAVTGKIVRAAELYAALQLAAARGEKTH